MMVGHHSKVVDLELIPETLDHDKIVNEVPSVGRSNQDRMGRASGHVRQRIERKGYRRMAMEAHDGYSSHTSYETKREIGRYRFQSLQLRVAD